ncbi:hypothetical protein MMC18_004102 [Xylographa bjoerkii]|nr:hypothetical protein [Xylographa bjoerkii]
MPFTDSEATSGGFIVDIIGVVLASIEFFIVWCRRVYLALVYLGLAEPSYKPPTEAEYSTLQARLRIAEAAARDTEDLLNTEREARRTNAEAAARDAEDVLNTEREAHQTIVEALTETQRTELRKVQDELLVAQTKLDCWDELKGELRRDLEAGGKEPIASHMAAAPLGTATNRSGWCQDS